MMKDDVISDDLSRRLDALVGRTTLTRSQIIEDALARGRTLAWQEKWAAGVQAGLDDADRGLFASDDELAAVLNKYGAA